MWESVLLEETLVRGLLKSAIRSGHISLARPETEDQKQQIDDVLKGINRSKSEESALTYCLLADSLYLDASFWDVFAQLEDKPPEVIESRPLLCTVAPELSAFLNTTNSIQNNFLKSYQRPPQELANMYSALEPLIWRSYKKAGIARNTLRLALDILVLAPELISIHSEPEFESEVISKAQERIGRKVSAEEGEYLGAVAYIAITKGYVAVSKLLEAGRRNAVYPVPGLATGMNRANGIPPYFKAYRSELLMAATKVFLDEIEYWPVVRNIDELLKIRSAHSFIQFRDVLRRWVDAAVRGDDAEQLALRRDIKKANSALRRSATCAKVGRWFTYLGLPLIALDALTLPVFGTPLTVAGFGFQAYADTQQRKGQWLIVGK